MWLALACTLGALAGDDPEPEELDVPSALDGLLSSDEPGRRIVPFDEDGGKATASWIVWPLSASTRLPAPGDARAYRSTYLGVLAGRRWYRLGADPGYLIEATVSAMFPLGPRMHGRELRASVLGGPRFGLVSLQVGPVVASNELHLDEGGGPLPEAAFAGGRGVIMLSVDRASLFVGFEPVWRIAGERTPLDWSALPIPGFGHEATWMAGLVVPVLRHWSVMVGDNVWLSAVSGPAPRRVGQAALHHYVLGVTLR